MLKRLIKDTSIQTTGKVVTILISLVTTAWLTRYLGLEQYGIFTLTTSIFLLIDAMADFGTRVIGVREAAVNEQDKEKIWINAIILRKVTTSIAFLAGLLLLVFYEGFEGYRLWVLIALSMSWFTSVAGDEEMIFQTENRLDLKTIVDVLYPGGFLVLLLLFGNSFNLGWVFGGYLVSRCTSLLVGYLLIRSHAGHESLILKNIRIKIDWKIIKKLIIESWPMGVYILLFTSYDRAVDAAMIRAFWSEAEVAQYGLAYKIYGNLVMPAYFLVSSVYPTMAKNEDKSAMRKAMLVAGIMVAGIIPIIWLMAPWIINVLAGSEFGESVGALRILLIALFFAYFGHIFGFKLVSEKGQKRMLGLGLSALIINLSLNWLLIPYFGIKAAAWVTALTEALMAVLMAVSLRSK